MAGTCEHPTPATILATVHFRFAEGFDLVLGLLLGLVADFAFACPCASVLRAARAFETTQTERRPPLEWGKSPPSPR